MHVVSLFAGVLKDFLQELPEPLLTNSLYRMLLDAISVQIPDDPGGNAEMMFNIIDCLPKVNQVINLAIEFYITACKSRFIFFHFGSNLHSNLISPTFAHIIDVKIFYINTKQIFQQQRYFCWCIADCLVRLFGIATCLFPVDTITLCCIFSLVFVTVSQIVCYNMYKKADIYDASVCVCVCLCVCVCVCLCVCACVRA